jgi:hypothetical protein
MIGDKPSRGGITMIMAPLQGLSKVRATYQGLRASRSTPGYFIIAPSALNSMPLPVGGSTWLSPLKLNGR